MKRGLKDEEEEGMSIYNTEVYIIQNDGFVKKMGMKEEEENARNIYNTEVYIIQKDEFERRWD
jgi:hypothetical protein